MHTSTSSSTHRSRGEGEGQYPLAADVVERAGRVSMPRLPRPYAPGATVHVVGRCNNREFCFTTPDDFKILLSRLEEMARNYGVTLYAYTLMANHVHLCSGAPDGALGAAPALVLPRDHSRLAAHQRPARPFLGTAILGLSGGRRRIRSRRPPVLRSQSRPCRSRGRSGELSLVQLRRLRSRGAKPAGTISSELSRAQSVPQGSPTPLPAL